jgi:hypothetical protein
MPLASVFFGMLALFAVPILLAVGIGCILLRRAFARAELLPEELALAVAWVFLVGSFVWLKAFVSGSTLLGFGAPWTWIAASHFAAAGFGALTVTAPVESYPMRAHSRSFESSSWRIRLRIS